ncbi:MAG: PAS domain S-box protein [Prolixibacteraceae bacterium]|nr:PAS domain S-box protein [Prolixibacteraceae bacterium]
MDLSGKAPLSDKGQPENKKVGNSGSSTEDDYLRRIKDLEVNQEKLELKIRELSLQEENAVKVSEKFIFLGDSTSEMLDLPDLQSIYNYIATSLQKHLPDTVILFNSVDEENKIVQLETISGIENKFLKQIMKLAGFNPVGKKFKLIGTHDNYFRSGKFVEFQGNLAEFSASDISPALARTFEKLVGLHKIYTIGIKKDIHLLAAIHFFTFNKKVIYDCHFIETFVKQAGIVIQKKMAEKALVESEEKYRNIFENVQDVYYEASIDGKILEVSPSVELFSKGQYTREEIIGNSIFDFYANTRELDELLLILKEQGEFFDHEISLADQNGLLIPCLVSSKLRFDENGLPGKIIGSIHDISKRKQIENALLESEAKYRDIFKSSPVGIWEEDFSKVKQRFEYLRSIGVKDITSYLDENPSEIENLASLVQVLSVNNTSIKMLEGDTKDQIFEGLNNFFIEESMPVFKQEMIALESGKLNFECEIPVVTFKGNKRLFQLSLAVSKKYHDSLSRVLISFLDITERKQADDLLRESEERYRTLFTEMQEGFALHEIICDDNGHPCDYRFLEMNPAFERQTGLKADDIRGKRVLEVLPDNEKYWIETFGKVALTGKFTQMENYSKALNKYYNVAVFSPKQNQFAVFLSDITERKLAELKLVQTKESYLDVFNSVIEAIYIQDGETGQFIDVNKGALMMYGCTRQKIVGQTPEIVAAPGMNNLEDISKISRQVFETGIPAHFEFWGIRENGEVFPKEVFVNKGTYFGKEVLIATARDVSENVKIQEQLKKQALFRQLLIEISSTFINLPLESVDNSINNSLAVMGRFAKADRAYIFDFDNETGLCTNTYEWCGEGIEPQIESLQNVDLSPDWIEVFRNGGVIYINDVLSLPEGRTREVLEPQGIKSLIAVPMMNQGICIGFIGLDSVSQLHLYSDTDQQLLTVSAQLLVNIRLRIQSEENIINAKEKAEESDRLKSTFLANMSHEIRTPLNAIIGFAELVGDPDFTIEQHIEFATLISESGNNLLSIISNIMDLSKIEAGQVQVKKSEFSVNRLIKSVQKEFARKAMLKGIEIRLDPLNPTEEIVIESDETKVRQILTNLVGNAIKFTEVGFIEIGIKITGNSIQLQVKDTGIGIPEVYHDRIFERFRQVETSHTRKYGGNGLGLSISKSLVELLGGTIGMGSVNGGGSTFYFSIPRL